MSTDLQPRLEVEALRTGFGSSAVLHGIDLAVTPGTASVLLGLNGAGKSVTLSCISGLVPAWSGQVRLDGVDLVDREPEDRVRAGLGHVLQARALFPDLTVEQNLRLGGATLGRGWREAADRIYDTYAVLGERRTQRAGSLSGGEQEMLAIGRALMTSPRMLLIDEPSAGLSPAITGELVGTLLELKATGATILMVEQNVNVALRVADRVIVLDHGTVAHEADVADLDRDVLARMLGIGSLVGSIRS